MHVFSLKIKMPLLPKYRKKKHFYGKKNRPKSLPEGQHAQTHVTIDKKEQAEGKGGTRST